MNASSNPMTSIILTTPIRRQPKVTSIEEVHVKHLLILLISHERCR